jgi:hypothetical protein
MMFANVVLNVGDIRLNSLRYVAAFALVSASPLFASPAPRRAAQNADPEKVVCQRIVDTGSLVRGARVCKTRRDWRLEHDGATRAAEDMQAKGMINSEAPH